MRIELWGKCCDRNGLEISGTTQQNQKCSTCLMMTPLIVFLGAAVMSGKSNM